jgi:GTP-binding protein Era
MTNKPYRAGYVAFIGRPNAGKSTLLNQLVGQKIAAVSDKPQTTRFRIQGIINKPEGQIVLVDTPGVHKPGYEMNRRMMAIVQDALMGVDLVCLIRDASVSTGAGDRRSRPCCCSTRLTNSKTRQRCCQCSSGTKTSTTGAS